jgi:FkbM family methyltransferase
MRLFFKILFKDLYHLLGTRNSREFLRLAFLHGNAPRYQLRKVNFLGYRLQVPDGLSFLWQFKEIFTDEAYKFHTTRSAPVIYDCGANVGTSCLYFKSIYPQAKIRAFEADPQITQLLEKNLQANGISDILVVGKAVWTDEQGIEIGLEGADGASVFSQGKKIRIPSVRLSKELQNEPYVDMLKIDIEGAETAVLEDCQDSLTNVAHIFIEYHAYLHQAQDLDKILHILTRNHFRYFIRDAQDRKSPFVAQQYKNNNGMDLQLNIFAYQVR